jgi:hypothetical protein
MRLLALLIVIVAASVSAALTSPAHAVGGAPVFGGGPVLGGQTFGPDNCTGVDCGGGGDTCYGKYQYGGYYDWGGYSHDVGPAVGTTASATVKMLSDALRLSGDHVAAYVDVENTTNTKWIQTGVEQEYGNSLEKYIEYNDGTDHIIWEGAASFGSGYAVSIQQTSSGVYKATVAGSSLTETLGFTGSQATTDYSGESFDLSPTNCNNYDAVFSSLSPWTTSSSSCGTGYVCPYISPQPGNVMTGIQGVTSTGFEVDMSLP